MKWHIHLCSNWCYLFDVFECIWLYLIVFDCTWLYLMLFDVKTFYMSMWFNRRNSSSEKLTIITKIILFYYLFAVCKKFTMNDSRMLSKHERKEILRENLKMKALLWILLLAFLVVMHICFVVNNIVNPDAYSLIFGSEPGFGSQRRAIPFFCK